MPSTGELQCQAKIHESPTYGRVLEIALVGSESRTRPYPGTKVIQEEVARHRPQYLVINLLGFDYRFGNALIGELVAGAAAMQKLGGGRKTGIVAAGRTAAELDRILPLFKITSIFGGRTFSDLDSALSNLSSMPALPAGSMMKTESRGGRTQPMVKTETESGRTPPEVEDLSLNSAVFLALRTLVDGERHDYGIMGEVARRAKGNLNLPREAEPRLMCDLGLTEVTGKRIDLSVSQWPRPYYRLTDLGRRLLAAEAEQAAALAEKEELPQVQEKRQPALELEPKYADTQSDMSVMADAVHVPFYKENDLARLWMHVGRYDEAEALLRRVLETNPDAPRGLLNLGITLNYMGRYKDAVEPLAKLVLLRPHWSSPRIFLGIALLEMGRPAEALTHLERGTRATGRFQALACLYLGKLYAQQGKTEKAAAAWRTYLDQDPDSPNARRVQEWLAELGRPPLP